jgi:hypothetical protein
MNTTFRIAFCAAFLLAARPAWPSTPPSASPQGEDALIAVLASSDTKKVSDAIDQLVSHYPKSTNALPALKALLQDNLVQRKAAHALGEYHAELNMDEVKVILGFLRAYDVDEVMDALKILRALPEPPPIAQKIVADILPLLHDPETHVVRDSCRTLAVFGNKQTIPSLEPLLQDRRSDIRKDAQDALDKLRAKP